MTEPDPDRGHVDGSPPGEVAFVVPGGHGAVLTELAEGALDDVALLIGRSVEGGRAAAPAAAPQPVAGLVRGLGNGGFDPAAAQVSTDRAAGIGLSPSTRPGRVRGRPGHRRAIFSWPVSGAKASESWRCPALVTRASGRHPESASRWILLVSPPRDRPSASRLRNCPAPRKRAGSLSTAGASRAGSTSAGGARRAPAACWCARTTVASTATVRPWPSASSHPARSRLRIISQVPSADQRRCRL